MIAGMRISPEVTVIKPQLSDLGSHTRLRLLAIDGS
jgi:hypothetical protein